MDYKKHKILKILKNFLLVIACIYVMFLVFNLYLLYLSVDKKYANQKYDYTRAKLCYECARGIKDGICPKIKINMEGMNPYYPRAVEYTGKVEYIIRAYCQLTSNKINEDLIIKHDYCYSGDWMDRSDYLGMFSEAPSKNKIYSEILKGPNFLFELFLPIPSV